MTREEAIDVFRSIDRYFCTTKETHDAIEIAIEALKEREKDGDLIRRQDVINEIVAWTVEVLRSSNAEMSTDLISRIKALPTARKTGEWIWEQYDSIFGLVNYWHCSRCGFRPAKYLNYCPNCGADMRGNKHETD